MRDRDVDGQKVRSLRISRGMTRNQLRRLISIDGRVLSYSHLKYVELGIRAPSDLVAHQIALALECSVDDFSTPRHVTEAAA